MTMPAQEWTGEERVEKIAESLIDLGLDATTEDTGGGIYLHSHPTHGWRRNLLGNRRYHMRCSDNG